MSLVLIVGATGEVGSVVLKHLLALSPRPSLRVSSRDPSKLSFLSNDSSLGGVEVVKADLSDPSCFPALFANVDTAFLYIIGTDKTNKQVVDAAKAAGVKKLVLLSSEEVVTAPGNQIGLGHKMMEDSIVGSGLRYVFLRPTAFSSNALFLFTPQLHQTGKVLHPNLAYESAPIANEDIADVALVALTTERLDNQAPILTGPQSLSYKEQLEIMDRVSKEEGKAGVTFEEVAPEQWRASMSYMPSDVIDMLLEYWQNCSGHTLDGKAILSDQVEKITGKQAMTFDAWVRAYKAQLF